MIFKSNFFQFLIHFLLIKVWKSFLLYFFMRFDCEYKFYIFLLLLLFEFCNIITIYLHDLLLISKIYIIKNILIIELHYFFINSFFALVSISCEI